MNYLELLFYFKITHAIAIFNIPPGTNDYFRKQS